MPASFTKLFSLRNSKAARNGFWIVVERIFSVGIALLITVISARYLGAANYGVLNYGASLVALFSGVMKLGLDSIMVNELIMHKDKQGDYLGTSIVLRLASSMLSILAIGILLLTLNGDDRILIMVALIQAFILIFQSFNILDYWFQSRLQSKFVSIAKVIAVTLAAGYSGYLLVSGKDVLWFAASVVVSSIIVAISLLIFYGKQGGDKLSFSLVSARALLSKSHHFIIANIISLVYIQIDKLMIANTIDNTQLGIYSAAIVIATGWTFLPDAVITSLRPVIVHAKEQSQELYIKRLKQLYFLLFWGCVAISAILAMLAPFVIAIIFGEDFAASAIIIQIIVWYIPLSMLGIARNIWLVAEEKHKFAKYILIYGVIVNVSLNLLLLPILGIAGAALATVITEVVTCFVAPLFYKSIRPHYKILIQALIYKI